MPGQVSKHTSITTKRLRAAGKSVPQWAKENGFSIRAVRAVIYGHNKGNYGTSHKIAVALGIKDPPDADC